MPKSRCMRDKASPAGWVVQALTPAVPSEDAQSRWVGRLGAGPPSFRYFNVAIAAPLEAIKAIKEQLTEKQNEDWEMSVVRRLSEPEVVALRLNAGDAKPA